jgi:hypothetical protein
MPGQFQFSDYLTLQQSLILLPADDEDCIGAVLSALMSETSESSVREGDYLTKLDDTDLTQEAFDRILAMLRDAKYPLTLTFALPPVSPTPTISPNKDLGNR